MPAAHADPLPIGVPSVDALKGSLADKVYSMLMDELHEFRLLPGDRLSEVESAQRFGVSRTPLREALFRLRNEGFLEVEPKTGWFVRHIDFDKLEELYDLRIVLELWSVARLCALPVIPAGLIELRDIWLVPVAERLTDGRVVGQNDERFHTALVVATGNGEMARVHHDLTTRIRIIRRLDFTRNDRIEATYIEHGKILRAILQRKADQAQLLLRAHIEQSKVEVRNITLHSLQAARRLQQR